MRTLSAPGTWLARASSVVHTHFFRLLIGSYAVAAVWPAAGLRIRDVTLGRVALLHENTILSLPLILLSLVLFNAGLGVEASRLRTLTRRSALLVGGLVANLLIPIAFILGVTWGMRPWHNPDEVQNILVGLALVASMPIAGSSTAWSQNADGDLALSLGLVLGSTLLSPLTTPLALHAVGLMASGAYAARLNELASEGTGVFLAIGVIMPSLFGIVVRLVLGEQRVASAKPVLRLLNSGVLLTLNYSNASVSLPQAIASPDLDFLAMTLGITSSLCALAFGAGWAVARLLKTDRAQQASLMFGLGMNNNGTGLVLASLALADHPRVMLPIILYNLVQHLMAGASGALLSRSTDAAQASTTGTLDEQPAPWFQTHNPGRPSDVREIGPEEPDLHAVGPQDVRGLAVDDQ